MTRRFVLALACVAILATSAGCLAYVTDGGEVSNETLDVEPDGAYDFDTDRDVAVTLTVNATYRAVYNVSDRDEIRLYSETVYQGDQPMEFEAFRYQYPNGTVLNGTEFRAAGGEVDQTPDETFVRFTDEMEGGKMAFSGTGSPRRFTMLTYIEGSYAVTLPPEFTTEFPVVGHVSPGGYEVVEADGRNRIVWDSVTSNSIVVQSYRDRDLTVFGAILVIALIAAVVGTLYFRRQLEELRRRRREMGLGIDEDENER